MRKGKRALWRCPKCKRRLPQRKAMHVCAPPVPLAAHFKGKSPRVHELFGAVRAAVKKLGPVVTDATKSRIAFAGQTIFLEVSPQQNALRGCLMLGRRARHASFVAAITPSPGRHYHFFRLTERCQVDARFRRLLAEAYRVVGRREHLRQPMSQTREKPTTNRPAYGETSRFVAATAHRAKQPMRKAAAPPRRGRLWQCGKCGRRFVSRNLWHSCVRISVGSHFRGKNPKLRRTFDALVRALRKNGLLIVNANKTRISLQARMRFAGVQVQKDGLRCGLTLTRRVRDGRFFQVVSFGPRSFGYTFRLRDPKQIDARLRRYLAEAYKVGQQEHLVRG